MKKTVVLIIIIIAFIVLITGLYFSFFQTKTIFQLGGCIPSGDHVNIQNALKGAGSKAVLCKNSVFELKDSIVFTQDNQEIYTEGFPTDGSRAVLKVSDPDLVAAIDGESRSGVKIRNIIVDGNRPNLGYLSTDKVKGKRALLQLGGDGASGQVVEWVKAYEPRSWTIIDLFEGSENSRCSGVVIRNNQFGPSGQPDGTWADGVSLSCRNSIVENNIITDATDGGIVVFGAPGSVIRNNTVRAETRRLLGGINMVDYIPYKGDYTGTQVIGNTIDASGAPIKIGLGMGYRVFRCYGPDDPNHLVDLTLRGGVVKNNILKGKFMGYGFAVSGITNWTVQDNIDQSTHSGKPVNECNGVIPSEPSGFQIDKKYSSGNFQKEFQEANLDLAVWGWE